MVDVTRTRNGYWQQVEEIFHQALEMPLDARAAFVHERCGGDAVMEREVLGTLAGYEAQDRISALRAAKSIEGARYGAFAKTDIDLSIWRRHIHPHAGFKQGEIHDPPLTFQPFRDVNGKGVFLAVLHGNPGDVLRACSPGKDEH